MLLQQNYADRPQWYVNSNKPKADNIRNVVSFVDLQTYFKQMFENAKLKKKRQMSPWHGNRLVRSDNVVRFVDLQTYLKQMFQKRKKKK